MTAADEWAGLARLAEAIPPERRDWSLIGGGECVTPIGVLVAPDDGGVSAEVAEFIAAANPATVLRLITENRRLWNHARRNAAQRDELARRLAAVEALVSEWERVQKQNRKALGELARGASHLLLDTPGPADFRAALAAPTDTTKEQS